MTCSADLELPRESVQHIRIGAPGPDVDLAHDVILHTNPTATPVDFAFVDAAAPTRPIAAWTAGTYITITPEGAHWRAVIQTPQIGVGGLDLVPGYWRIFARYTLGGDTIVDEVGIVLIT